MTAPYPKPALIGKERVLSGADFGNDSGLNEGHVFRVHFDRGRKTEVGGQWRSMELLRIRHLALDVIDVFKTGK